MILMIQQFYDQILDILLIICENGGGNADKVCDKLREKRGKQPSPKQLQEEINHLRLCVKYMLFDLEASRREIVQLKKDK